MHLVDDETRTGSSVTHDGPGHRGRPGTPVGFAATEPGDLADEIARVLVGVPDDGVVALYEIYLEAHRRPALRDGVGRAVDEAETARAIRALFLGWGAIDPSPPSAPTATGRA